MNTSLKNREPQLLVDLEVGRVLRGDDHPVSSRRWVDTHPFIEQEGDTIFAGPDAARAARARKHGQPIAHLDVLEYAIESEVAGALRLTRKVDA